MVLTVTAYDSEPAPSPYQPPPKKSGRTFAWGVGRAIVWFVYALALVAIVIASLAFVLQLFADRSHEDRTQRQCLQTIGSDRIIKLVTLARNCAIPPYPIAFMSDRVSAFKSAGVE